MTTRCPHCNVPLTQEEARSERCPACGKSLLDGSPPGAEDDPSPRRRPDELIREGKPSARRDDYDERVGEGRPPSRLAGYDDDDDDEDRPGSRRSYGGVRNLDAGWRTVQGGLNTMFFSYLTIVGGYLLYFALAVVMIGAIGGMGRNQPGNPNPNPLILAPLCLVVLVIFGGAIAHLVGIFMCLAAPRAKRWIGWSLAFLGFGILLLIGTAVLLVAATAGGGRADPTASLIQLAVGFGFGYLCLFVSIVCLIVFLRKLGQYFGNAALVLMCNFYFGIQFFSIGCMVAVVTILLNAGNLQQIGARNQLPDFGNLGVLAISIYALGALGGLIVAILYPVMLRSARNMIARA